MVIINQKEKVSCIVISITYLFPHFEYPHHLHLFSFKLLYCNMLLLKYVDFRKVLIYIYFCLLYKVYTVMSCMCSYFVYFVHMFPPIMLVCCPFSNFEKCIYIVKLLNKEIPAP